MVKGISKNVILLKPADNKLFEQAIFILRDGSKQVSDEMLLKEAGVIASGRYRKKKGSALLYTLLGGLFGALITVALFYLLPIL